MKKNEKKSKKMIIIITILIILIGGISLLIANIMKEKKESTKNIEIIEYNYNELSTNVSEYNQIRSDLSEKLNNFFYDKYPKEHETYVELLTKYNNNIKKIDKNISNINDRCNVIYKDKNINSICNNYKVTYEKLINLYITDLTNYNNKITSYNEYQDNEDVNLFELIHKDYIDYNNDNTYEGKDVNNEENN